MSLQKINWKDLAKKTNKRALQTVLTLFVVLCVVELAYRYQWFDFYSPEFKALNKNIDTKKPRVLFFGDSFSAQPNGYIDQLRERHPEYCFVNSAVPGTGPLEMSVMAKGRIEKFNPRVVVYQMYVGNDLLDIDPPVNWGKLSFSRNLFWTFKQRFQVLGLISRRMKGVQTDFDPDFNSRTEDPFSISRYSPRTRLYIDANPNYVNQCVMNHPLFEDAKETSIEEIEYLREIVPLKTPIYILVMPHFSQVTEELNMRYQELGGSKTSTRVDYPFIKSIEKIKGVSVLNPLEMFRNASFEGEQVFYNNDPHLSPNGLELVAQYLEEELLNKEE